MYLIRDVLDKTIVDCDEFVGGKVDDLALSLPQGERPVVCGIVTQFGSLAPYTGRTLSHVYRWLAHHVLGLKPGTMPTIIEWDHVTRIDSAIHIDVGRRQAGLLEGEDAVWEKIVRHLPFAQR